MFPKGNLCFQKELSKGNALWEALQQASWEAHTTFGVTVLAVTRGHLPFIKKHPTEPVFDSL